MCNSKDSFSYVNFLYDKLKKMLIKYRVGCITLYTANNERIFQIINNKCHLLENIIRVKISICVDYFQP